VKAGARGALSALVADQVGGIFRQLGNFADSLPTLYKLTYMAAHGVTQGAVASAFGGDFASTALSAGAAKGLSLGWDALELPDHRFLEVAAAAVIGGTASEIGGGKFANGAITGAFVTLFNSFGDAGIQRDSPSYVDKKVAQAIANSIDKKMYDSLAEAVDHLNSNPEKAAEFFKDNPDQEFSEAIVADGQIELRGQAVNKVLPTSTKPTVFEVFVRGGWQGRIAGQATIQLSQDASGVVSGRYHLLLNGNYEFSGNVDVTVFGSYSSGTGLSLWSREGILSSGSFENYLLKREVK